MKWDTFGQVTPTFYANAFSSMAAWFVFIIIYEMDFQSRLTAKQIKMIWRRKSNYFPKNIWSFAYFPVVPLTITDLIKLDPIANKNISCPSAVIGYFWGTFLCYLGPRVIFNQKQLKRLEWFGLWRNLTK